MWKRYELALFFVAGNVRATERREYAILNTVPLDQ